MNPLCIVVWFPGTSVAKRERWLCLNISRMEERNNSCCTCCASIADCGLCKKFHHGRCFGFRSWWYRLRSSTVCHLPVCIELCGGEVCPGTYCTMINTNDFSWDSILFGSPTITQDISFFERKRLHYSSCSTHLLHRWFHFHLTTWFLSSSKSSLSIVQHGITLVVRRKQLRKGENNKYY